MLKAAAFRDLIRPADQSKVCWSGRPGGSDIPVFGRATSIHMRRHLAMYKSHFESEGFSFGELPQEVFFSSAEEQCMLGAVCAARSVGRLVDLGCGAGLASLAFSVLADRSAVGLDSANRYFPSPTRLATFVRAKYSDLAPSLVLSAADVVLISHPEKELFDAWKDIATAHRGSTVVCFRSAWLNTVYPDLPKIRTDIPVDAVLNAIRFYIRRFAQDNDLTIELALSEAKPASLVFVVSH
ncbi:hypothetical protein HY990_07095 [Candidatus Micrarchaeota archaeon]|nr:hypothetical protein [Candidatus Micrarchaeota archaeon]